MKVEVEKFSDGWSLKVLGLFEKTSSFCDSNKKRKAVKEGLRNG
jgi:hypothetical protein